MKKRKILKVILTSFITVFMLMTSILGQVDAASSQLVYNYPTTDKVVAITFDDLAGAQAEAMLNILNNYGINASFFFLGYSIEENPDLVKAISDAGNFVGNHSYSHPYLPDSSDEEILAELQETEDIIVETTGKHSMPYYRPPYGGYDNDVLQVAGDLGFTKTILWTIESYDWQGISKEEIVSNVLTDIGPGAIILLHTSPDAINTQYALPTIIESLLAQGYSFATIPEMFGDTDDVTSTTVPTTQTSVPSTIYSAHVQSYGWLSAVLDGQTAGTTGLYKRMEALKLSLDDESNGGITYRAHVQTYGWQSYVSDGKIAGTTGLYKRMEAIQISLTGTIASQYDVVYRVHVQHYGWMEWVKNGEIAGTTGLALRMEAIEIYLVPKS